MKSRDHSLRFGFKGKKNREKQKTCFLRLRSPHGCGALCHGYHSHDWSERQTNVLHQSTVSSRKRGVLVSVQVRGLPSVGVATVGCGQLPSGSTCKHDSYGRLLYPLDQKGQATTRTQMKGWSEGGGERNKTTEDETTSKPDVEGRRRDTSHSKIDRRTR